MQEGTWYVYIVSCVDGSLYTGITTNVERRVAQHNTGKGAKYTRARRPVSLLSSWPFSDMSSALKEEHRIKKLSRAKKEALLK